MHSLSKAVWCELVFCASLSPPLGGLRHGWPLRTFCSENIQGLPNKFLNLSKFESENEVNILESFYHPNHTVQNRKKSLMKMSHLGSSIFHSFEH